MKHVFIRKQLVYQRRGVTAVLVVITLPVLLGMAALCIDVGHMYAARAELQNSADAAALAAASLLPDVPAARSAALQFANLNSPGHGTVLADADVRFGNWDPDAAVFSEAGVPFNAVEIITRRSQVNGNPLQFFFASLLGVAQTDVSAGAVAGFSNACSEWGIIAGRFVIIEEFELDDSLTDYCTYGRQGVTVNEIDIDHGNLIFGALDTSTVVIPPDPGVQIVQDGLQPTRAQRAPQLIDEIEAGLFGEPGMSVVVLAGPMTFGTGAGEVVPVPNTAYVVNGDATFADDVDLMDVIIGVRGSMLFKKDVDVISSPPTGPDDLPVTLVATVDIRILDEDLEASGVAIIAGRDFIVEDDLEIEPPGGGLPTWGLSIEAGRDIIINDDLELEDLNPLFAVAFGGATTSPLQLVR